MKILIATHHSPPNYLGGVEWVTLHGAQWLQAHGHEVEIVSIEEIRSLPGGEVTSQEETYQGIRIQRLSIPASPDEEKFQQSYWNGPVGRWFEQHLKEQQPDIVHLHSGYLITVSVLEAARNQGIPTVLSLHDYWTVCPRINLLHPDGRRCPGPEENRCAWCLLTEKRRFRWLEQLAGRDLQPWVERPPLARWFGMEEVSHQVRERQEKINQQLQQVDVIMALSELTQKMVLQQGIDPEKVMLSPNGLNISRWPKPLPAKKPSQTFRFGYLGNLTPIKGAQVLVQAFRKLTSETRALELRLYGDAKKDPAFSQRLQRLAGGDGRIRWMGVYENQRLPEILSEIDVLVVPSLWYEIGPLVILEGFACLTPLVVSDLPNMNNQISEGVNGLTFEAGNPLSLANSLQRFLNEPNLLAHLTYGIRPIRSHDDQMKDWLKAYKMALGRRP